MREKCTRHECSSVSTSTKFRCRARGHSPMTRSFRINPNPYLRDLIWCPRFFEKTLSGPVVNRTHWRVSWGLMSKITTASINGNGEIFSRLAFVNELWIMHPRACTNTCMWIITRQTLTRSRTSRHADIRTSRRNNLGTGGWWRGREGLCGCSDGIRVTWSSLWIAWFVMTSAGGF